MRCSFCCVAAACFSSCSCFFCALAAIFLSQLLPTIFILAVLARSLPLFQVLPDTCAAQRRDQSGGRGQPGTGLSTRAPLHPPRPASMRPCWLSWAALTFL